MVTSASYQKLRATGFAVLYAKRPKRGPRVLNQSPILSGFVPTVKRRSSMDTLLQTASWNYKSNLYGPARSLNGFLSAKSKSFFRHLHQLRFRQDVDIAARVTRRWPTGPIIYSIHFKSHVQGFHRICFYNTYVRMYIYIYTDIYK